MKKIFIPPIVVLIVMSVVALWSAFRLQAIPESAEIPSAALRFTALIVGAVIAACIILVTIAGDFKLEKIPAEKIAAEEVPVEEEVAVKPPEAPPKPVGEAEEMVVCGGCGALVPASSKTCPNCGAEFEE